MKRINLHFFRTGLVKRYAHYKTKTGVSCAKGLLDKFGWNTSSIKYLPAVGEYYLFASVRNHRPTVNQYTVIVDRRNGKS